MTSSPAPSGRRSAPAGSAGGARGGIERGRCHSVAPPTVAASVPRSPRDPQLDRRQPTLAAAHDALRHGELDAVAAPYRQGGGGARDAARQIMGDAAADRGPLAMAPAPGPTGRSRLPAAKQLDRSSGPTGRSPARRCPDRRRGGWHGPGCLGHEAAGEQDAVAGDLGRVPSRRRTVTALTRALPRMSTIAAPTAAGCRTGAGTGRAAGARPAGAGLDHAAGRMPA